MTHWSKVETLPWKGYHHASLHFVSLLIKAIWKDRMHQTMSDTNWSPLTSHIGDHIFDATFSSPFIIELWLELTISYILNIILSYSMEYHDIRPTFYFLIAGKPSATREVQHGQHRNGKSNTAGTVMFALYGNAWWAEKGPSCQIWIAVGCWKWEW